MVIVTLTSLFLILLQAQSVLTDSTSIAQEWLPFTGTHMLRSNHTVEFLAVVSKGSTVPRLCLDDEWLTASDTSWQHLELSSSSDIFIASVPVVDRCREYYFEFYDHDGNQHRWPTAGALFTYEQGDCVHELPGGKLWTLFFADVIIALSYFAIPGELLYFIQKHRAQPFLAPFTWVFVMFGLFITACGTTHLVAVFGLFTPSQTAVMISKVVTAIVSAATALALIRVLPVALYFPAHAEAMQEHIDRKSEVLEKTMELYRSQRRVTQAVRDSLALEFRAILHIVTAELVRCLSVDHCAIFIPSSFMSRTEERKDGNMLVCMSEYILSPRDCTSMLGQSLTMEGVLTQIVETHRARELSAEETETHFYRAFPARRGLVDAICECVVVRITLPDQSFGLLVLMRRKAKQQFQNIFSRKSRKPRVSPVPGTPTANTPVPTSSVAVTPVTPASSYPASESAEGFPDDSEISLLISPTMEEPTADSSARDSSARDSSVRESRDKPEDDDPEDEEGRSFSLVFLDILEDLATQLAMTLAQADLIRKDKDQLSQLSNQNEQLTSARIAAEASNKSKNDFLTVMSHELRSPLHAIVGFTSLLIQTELSDMQKGMVQTIRTSADMLVTVINNILDFTDYESGRVNMEQRPFSLRSCVEDAIDLIRSFAGSKELHLNFAVEQNVPRLVIGDMTRLRQVLVNLLSNAVKFTHQGYIKAAVRSLTAQDKNMVPPQIRSMLSLTQDTSDAAVKTCYVLFSVSDSGIGIPEDRLGSLFEKFTLGDMSLTRTNGGTGLGLALCKKLVQNMGGHIWVASEKSKGSTFYFAIPLTLPPPGSSALSPSPSHTSIMEVINTLTRNGEPLQYGQQLAVLLVDRYQDDRLSLKSLLMTTGVIRVEAIESLENIQRPSETTTLQDAMLNYHVMIVDIDSIDQATLASLVSELPIILTSHRENFAMRDLPVVPTVKPIRMSNLIQLLRQSMERFRAHPSEKWSTISPSSSKPPSLRCLMTDLETSETSTSPGASSESASTPATALAQAQQPLNVLIVEDNKFNQMVTRHMLESLSCTVTVVNDGQEAVTLVKQQTFDVIFMDLSMPVMDGITATKIIVNNGFHGKKPWIIGLTANALSQDRESGLNAGMDDFLSKPATLMHLKAAVDRYRVSSGEQHS